MILKRSILLLVTLLIFGSLQAAFISKHNAEIVAKNFYWERYNQGESLNIENLTTETIVVELRNNKAVIYHFNFLNHGFVSVSADDAAYPIIAYDFKNHIHNEDIAPNFQEWMNVRADEIAFIRTTNLKASLEISSEWNRLSQSKQLVKFSGKSIDPLLKSTWNQDNLYNALSPVDQFGPGGRAYAGCVAVAMAQIIYYYRYPKNGVGSHSYYSNYGQLSANFAAATYDYNSMTNSMPNSGNMEIAELLYHCAVAVDMNFSGSGSGAYSNDAESSLKQNFGYQSSLNLERKINSSYTQWVNKIVGNIDSKIPLYYDGYSPTGGSGHAFNLDGYQGSDFFHFNWGWGSAFDGYFYLNTMNPGSSVFTEGHKAIFDIYPASTSYPLGCQNTVDTLSGTNGTVYDGSGPSTYGNNQDCQWFIQPATNIDYMKISFDELDLGNNDTLYIYDGANSNDPLLGKYSGGNLPSSINTSSSTALVHFVSDQATPGNGFGISYKSYMPVFCNGITQLTLDSDSFNDGSELYDYNNGTNCRWHIKPTNGQPIRLNFNNFNTEAGKDVVKVYDPSTSPATLLASHSGTNIPQSVVSTSGEMMVIFQSNQNTTGTGWEAYYISGPKVGIDEFSKEQNISIFPNPTNNRINIKFESIPLGELHFSIYATDGKLIQNINLANPSKTTSISTSELSEGYYILHIQTEQGVLSKSFIVKH